MTSYRRFEAFIEDIRNDKQACWKIPLSKIRVPEGVDPNTYLCAGVSKKYIASVIGLSPNTLSNPEYRPLFEELQKILVEYEVIVPGVYLRFLKLRQKAFLWWNGLTTEEKKELNIFGNRLQIRTYVDGWIKVGSSVLGSEILIEVENQFCTELAELGVLKQDYVPVKDRDKLRNKKFLPDLIEARTRWNELAELPLEKASHLIEPTSVLEPFIQVKQVFAVKIKSVSSDSGKKNYINAFGHFVAFLKAERLPSNSLLSDILNEFILARFKQDYINDKLNSNELAASTTPTLLSCVRQVLNRARKIKDLGFNSYYDVIPDDYSRSTLSYKPFSKSEREAINKAIQSDINEIKNFNSPFEKSGISEYELNTKGDIKSTLKNARFIFENHLNGKPVFNHTARTEHELAFMRIINGGAHKLHDIYRSWGVLPVVNQHALAPFVYRLAQITGMNVESIVLLDIDDLVLEHHATGKPCLRYWKERSTGQKELHLDLFQASLQWLTQKQSKAILDIFNTVIELTKSIRVEASAHIANRLFIYQSTGSNTMGQIMDFSKSKRLSSTYANFVNKHALKDEQGNPTQFVLTRFRPSFVSELISEGVSIREIQLLLGHQNLITTVGYLDKLDFNKVARDKIRDVLENIHRKVITPSNKESQRSYMDNPERVFFKTPLGGCANVFNPPKFIKESAVYIEGQPCSQYNKCLSCDNVMLTSSHLPELFAMRRDYLILFQRNRIMDTPYGVVIEENLCLLDEILTPEKSDFSCEELERGERLSEFVETGVIDNVGA